jgi:hypothetical protein
VRITPSSGEPFLATWGSGRSKDDFGELALGTEDDKPLTIAPNRTINVSLPAVDLSRPSWIRDPRLLQNPGTYRLEVLLYDARDAGGTSFVASSSATLTVAPVGAADQWILDAIARGEAGAVAAKVVETRPESDYAPYLAPLADGETVADRIAVVQRILDAHPKTPVHQWLQLRIAEMYIRASYQAFDRTHDVTQATQLADIARERLMRMRATGDAWAQRAAKTSLADVPERGAFEREANIIREKRIRKE